MFLFHGPHVSAGGVAQAHTYCRVKVRLRRVHERESPIPMALSGCPIRRLHALQCASRSWTKRIIGFFQVLCKCRVVPVLCVHPACQMDVCWSGASPLWRPSGGLAVGTSCWSRATSPCGPATSRTWWGCCSGWAGAGTWGSCHCLGTPWNSSWTWAGGYSAREERGKSSLTVKLRERFGTSSPLYGFHDHPMTDVVSLVSNHKKCSHANDTNTFTVNVSVLEQRFSILFDIVCDIFLQ